MKFSGFGGQGVLSLDWSLPRRRGEGQIRLLVPQLWSGAERGRRVGLCGHRRKEIGSRRWTPLTSWWR